MAGQEKWLRLFKVTEDPEFDPERIEPDSIYFIKPEGGQEFDIKVSDANGELVYRLKCCNDGGGTPGEPTGRPYKTYTVRLQQHAGEPPMIVDEFENEIGISLSFEYQFYGTYLGHVESGIPGRTVIFCNGFSRNGTPLATSATMADPQTMILYCAEDDNDVVMEIRQYE